MPGGTDERDQDVFEKWHLYPSFAGIISTLV
jgi:hypothetical protein